MKIEDLIQDVRNLSRRYKMNVYTPVATNGRYSAKYTVGQNSRCPRYGCIIGVALSALDSTRFVKQVLIEADMKGPVSIRRILKTLKIEYEKEHLEWLENVQVSQDYGHPWSLCVEAADNGTHLSLQETLV